MRQRKKDSIRLNGINEITSWAKDMGTGVGAHELTMVGLVWSTLVGRYHTRLLRSFLDRTSTSRTGALTNRFSGLTVEQMISPNSSENRGQNKQVGSLRKVRPQIERSEVDRYSFPSSPSWRPVETVHIEARSAKYKYKEKPTNLTSSLTREITPCR